jgi:hypothetical protein
MLNPATITLNHSAEPKTHAACHPSLPLYDPSEVGLRVPAQRPAVAGRRVYRATLQLLCLQSNKKTTHHNKQNTHHNS